jgi:hypothetical protein|tara:strand:- start:110 stop:670 length:561 start_codon:yes stop_codon:yes gene_type:complete
MAVLDVALLEHFVIVFPFLLIWVIVFGILSATKTFGDNKGIHAIIGLALAFLFILSKDAVAALNFASPWFVLLFMFIIFTIMAFKVFGASDSDVLGVLKNKEFRYIATWIGIISIIIMVAALSNVHGQRLLEEGGEGETLVEGGDGSVASGDFEGNVWNTIFHPKVLGLILVLLIASFTIRYMTQS